MSKIIISIDDSASLAEVFSFGLEVGKIINKSENKSIIREVVLE